MAETSYRHLVGQCLSFSVKTFLRGPVYSRLRKCSPIIMLKVMLQSMNHIRTGWHRFNGNKVRLVSRH